MDSTTLATIGILASHFGFIILFSFGTPIRDLDGYLGGYDRENPAELVAIMKRRRIQWGGAMAMFAGCVFQLAAVYY